MTNPTDPRLEAAARVIQKEVGGENSAFFDFLAADTLKAADAAAWRPIETAPLHQEIIIAWKIGTTSVGTKYGTGWKFSNGDEMYGVHAASGWQPLPKSP